jgi:Protein of unknown function (DUF3592)
MDDALPIPEAWPPPPELVAGRPRSVRLTGTGIYLSVLSILLLAGALPAAMAIRLSDAAAAARTETLRREGRAAVARVTARWLGPKNRAPYVSYTFDVDGLPRKATVVAPAAAWTTLHVGGPLTIRYLPNNPEVNYPSGWTERQIGPVAPVVVAALLAAIGVVLQITLRKSRRLLEDGVPTTGVITRSRFSKSAHFIRYRFLASGEVHNGRASVPDAYDVGDAVCVLVNPENPRRNTAYPLKLYRLG